MEEKKEKGSGGVRGSDKEIDVESKERGNDPETPRHKRERESD